MRMVMSRSCFPWPSKLTILLAGLAAMQGRAMIAGEDLGLTNRSAEEAKAEAHATGSPFDYNARIWQSDEGLPNNSVRDIVQTPDGYLWVATGAGLARFDGLSFTVFNSRNTPPLESDDISALCVDREGTLWIGTFGGGLACLEAGSFTHFGLTNGLVGTAVSMLYVSPDGSVWIGTTRGLSRYKDRQFTNLTRKEGLLSDIIRSVREDRAGDLWIGTTAGLNRLSGGVLSAFTRTNGLPDNSVRGLWQDRRGRLWIGSDSGMTCYDQGEFSTLGTREGLADGFVQTFREDSRGNFWVGTYSGIYRFRNGKFFPQLDGEGVPYDLTDALFEDREGDVWAGSREGLIRLTPRRFFTYTKRQGLAHDNVMCVLEDRATNIWIGTWGGGLNQLTDGKIKAYTTANGFPSSLILSACESGDGSLWVGADYDGGLTRLKAGQLTHYTWNDGLLNGVPHVLYEDRGGTLWIGTSRGLGCLQAGRFTENIPQARLAGKVVRAICEDHAGRLWFGAEDGLSCWKDGQFATFTVRDGLSSSVVLSLYEDAEHDLWVGTVGGGLNRWRNGKVSCYTTKQGLFSDDVLAILEDDGGYFWLSCLAGISRLRKADLAALDENKIEAVHAVSYGRLDGLISVQFNAVAQPAAWKSRDGRLWFPTTKGLVAVEAGIPGNEAPPPVVLEQAFVDKRPLGLAAAGGSVSGAALLPSAPAPDATPLRVLRDRGELEFHFTALSLQLPEKNRFKYKLEGVDAEWIEAGTHHTAYYHNVSPGAYRFLVMACNNDGVWNKTPASLALVLVPHYWQTTWFRVLTGLVLGGGLAGSVRYVSVKNLQRKLAALEREHAVERERARIAKDIHDDLGSRLTQITLLSDRAQAGPAQEAQTSVTKISATAREMAQSLDEIVWAVNPEHDTLEGLVEYLSQSADDFLEDTSIRSRLNLPAQLPRCIIPAEVRHQLFLAFKEALNNAVKHAAASEIHIQFSAEAGRLEILLADNGVGFDPAAARTGGNGLSNMRKRLEGIGGQFAVSSHPGHGTEIRLTIPLPPA
jgi:ligand-binding sensor domain-containing protein/signal transduction histidine kinase